ncbi:hypothetical protein [Sphingomonas sp. IC081]|uniref:hypothetical protein n=1 Tax=Sphingomonas sp. IC081 TaxID=304378 RepID=UPI0011597AA7|nr:hypothetical protein [Sphingomonas sp. IC081]QDK32118.1 hypothetical protein DM450_04840 [Sphingomonas sp. IC081]
MPAASSDAISTSHRTLSTGCAFWTAHAALPGTVSRQGSAVLARLNSNRLRELDGFLSHLIADILSAAGVPQPEAPKALRETSTLRRLRTAERLFGLDLGAEPRLIAAQRAAAALRRPFGTFCKERLRQDLRRAADLPETWGGNGPCQLDETTIRALCGFYRSLGDVLVDALARRGDMSGNDTGAGPAAERITCETTSRNDSIFRESGARRS